MAGEATTPKYTVKLDIDDEEVARLHLAGYQLCFAIGVGSSTEDFTMIAKAFNISNHIPITWSYEYSIAATPDVYSAGIQFDIANNMSSIKFKEKYVLPESWTTGKVSPDSDLEDGTFLFHNDSKVDASAVVYLKIKGVSTPVYITPSFVLAGGNQLLKPNKTIALWMQTNVETGTMISKTTSKIQSFEMTGRKTMSAKWSGSTFVEI